MHKTNILIIGSKTFTNSINEVKTYLKFNLFNDNNTNEAQIDNINGILIEDTSVNNLIKTKYFTDKNLIKIIALKNTKLKLKKDYEILNLPTTIKDINLKIESSVAKSKFTQNSSIVIKNYHLNKNEKKLTKENNSIFLTEKEIQLLELFLKSKKPISKNYIQSSVWQYANDADTHTVETHIYRLRKKINDKFSDDKFIMNNKEGYYI